MGRKKSDDLLYMHENNNFIFLKSRIILDKEWLKITNKPDSRSIIWIRNKSPLKFLKLSIPGLLGFFYLAISVFLIFENIFFIGDFIYVLSSIAIYILFNSLNFENYEEQNQLIEKVITECNSSQKNKTI